MAVPFFGLEGALPAESEALVAIPPGTMLEVINRSSGPESAPFVVVGSTVTHPSASGMITACGTGPQEVPGGGMGLGTGGGGGLVVPPDPATTIDWNVVVGPD